MTNFKWYRRLIGGTWYQVGTGGMFHTQLMWTRDPWYKCIYRTEVWS